MQRQLNKAVCIVEISYYRQSLGIIETGAVYWYKTLIFIIKKNGSHMATHKSALKRHRQSIKRRERNCMRRSAVKTAIKKALTAVQQANREAALPLVRQAERAIARAALKGTLHKKNARRKISRLAKAAAKSSK